MTEQEKQEIVKAVLDEIEGGSIDASVAFSVDGDGYLCVETQEASV